MPILRGPLARAARHLSIRRETVDQDPSRPGCFSTCSGSTCPAATGRRCHTPLELSVDTAE